MSDAPIRFGILGCADIARKVSRAISLSPNAALYAVASRSLSKSRLFAASNNFPPSAKTYGSYEALLDDPDVDAVYVPLPTSLHAAWAVAAARRGKHVLLEKPVAVDVAEFDGIVRACEENGVQLMDGTMWVHHPRVGKMKEFLSDPLRFGQLKTLRGLTRRPDVDAVYVPLPTSLHATWAVAAARRGKHVLLEKPVAVDVAEFDGIVKACEENGVQLMDGTMWVHHPRVGKMKEFLSDPLRFGQLKTIQSCFSFAANPNFLNNDIRVKPDLDGLGALGDAGWYCIRFSLWAADFSLPKTVTAFRDPVLNDSGVILSCGASLHWENGTVASFHCSFLANLTMNATAVGTKGSLHLRDFIIPFEEKKASFLAGTESKFDDLVTRWTLGMSENEVLNELPQEACMVREFADLVKGIKVNGLKPEKKWAVYSRKTQLVVDAVKASIDKGFEPVEVVY